MTIYKYPAHLSHLTSYKKSNSPKKAAQNKSPFMLATTKMQATFVL